MDLRGRNKKSIKESSDANRLNLLDQQNKIYKRRIQALKSNKKRVLFEGTSDDSDANVVEDEPDVDDSFGGKA